MRECRGTDEVVEVLGEVVEVLGESVEVLMRL